MRHTLRIALILTCSLTCVAFQAYELHSVVGHSWRLGALMVSTFMVGAACCSSYEYHAMRRHMRRISQKAAARRGVPSGSSTL